MLEHYLAAASDGNGGIELVRMAGERVQLLRGLGPGQRLVEKAVPQRQRLVGADDVSIRLSPRDSDGFLVCQQYCDIAGRGQAGRLLSGPFWRTWISRSGVACRLTTSGFVTLSS